MSKKKTIAYVGNFSFPFGNASGSRVLANGYTLKSLGYDVIFIGVDNTIAQDVSLLSTKSVYDDFTYYNLPYPAGIKGWLSYKKKFDAVSQLLVNYDLYAVISYGSPALSLFGKLLRRWCKKNSSFFIADVVDWMGAGVGSIAYRTIKYIDNNYQKIFLNSSSDGIITISKYLSSYYSKKGCKTVIIPPLVNHKRFENLEFNYDINAPINLIYIGRPFLTDGRKVKESTYKDRLDIVIESLKSVKEKNFVFNIYGLTKQEYLSVITQHDMLLEELKDKILFHGFIKNDEAINKIAEADFTMLFRYVNKMNTAGFPTKFTETISCGTPIITTRTSDLEEYLIENKNGFFVSIEDVSLLKEKLKEILSMPKPDILKMKEYCKTSHVFDYLNYQGKMDVFLKSL